MPGYGDDTGFNDWLTSNGHTLPVGAPSAAVLRQRGSTYVDSAYGSRFIGSPLAGVAQERAWPRTVYDGAIPAAVIEASYQAAWFEANNPGGLVAGGSAATAVKSEQVDVIKVEYAVDASTFAAGLTPLISTVDGLLAPFLSRAAPAIMVV